MNGWRVIGAAMLLLTLQGCSSSDCEHHVLQEVRSPDGTRKAVSYALLCGLMEGSGLHVAILRPDATTTDAGNVFVGNLRAPELVRGPYGLPRLTLKWRGNDTLQVDYDTAAVVWRKNHVRGVDVVYGVIPTQRKKP